MSRQDYTSHSSLPNILKGYRREFPDLKLKTERTSEQTLDELPRIKFNEERSNFFFTEFIEEYYNSPTIFIQTFDKIENSSFRDDGLCKQIQRLCIRLILFSMSETLNGFAIDPKEYLRCSLKFGPSFTQWLSKARAAAIVKSLSCKPLVKNIQFIDENLRDVYGILVVKERYDYDSFLNERFLIDFEESGHDFDWAFKPVIEDKESYYAFRMALKSLLLNNYVRDISPASTEEYGTWISDSITIENGGPIINRTLIRRLAAEQKLEEVIKTPENPIPMTFKRQVVQVDPGNIRDTWQCNIETLFVIKRVSHLLKQILEPIEYSAMCSPEQLLKKKKKLKSKSNFFMFDIKKCGLTINRDLIHIMGEELNELYPNLGFHELFSYDNITVYNENEPLRPPRGVGMGNCNEGVTLIQCVIGHMMKLRFGIDSLFFNDDGVFVSDEDVRLPFRNILSAFNALGIIINLEKTMISRFNVFCEDYITDNTLDYKKVQLSVVPFADVFFKRNIVSAKILYNSLIRGLIGRNIKVDFLPSIVSYWGYEFHKMEYFLPFEFGGWRYIGNTNVNEVIRYLFDPRIYSPNCDSQGFIPFSRLWMGYLVHAKQLEKLNVHSSKIKYKKFVPNPFQSWETILGDNPEMVHLLKVSGVQTNSDLRQSLDDLYNYRGTKNAKPKFKSGFLDKYLLTRKQVWRDFKSIQGKYLVLDRTPGDLKLVLDYLRDEESVPNNYLPPDFMISRTINIDPKDCYPKGRLIVPVFKQSHIKTTRWGINQLVRSLYLQQIYEGTEIFSLSEMIKRNKQRFILSNETLYDYGSEFEPPPWVYAFLPKREYARLLYINIYNKRELPVSWLNFPSHGEVIDMAMNPVKYIFPSCFKRWKKLLSMCTAYPHKKLISNVIKDNEILTSSDFDLLITILEEALLSDPSLRDNVRILHIETDTSNISIDVDENLTLEIMGERDYDDLLEDFINEEADGDVELPADEDDIPQFEDEEYEDPYIDIMDEDFDLEEENPDRGAVQSFQKDLNDEDSEF